MIIRRILGLAIGLTGELLIAWAEILDPTDFGETYFAWDGIRDEIASIVRAIA